MQAQVESATSILFDPQDIAAACAHIEEMWPKLTRVNSNDNGTLIGLPHPYIIPSADLQEGFVFEEMYYWDSYFIAQGLLLTGKNELAEGMLENLIYLYKRFHIIPNGSRFYFASRSQPPFLTSYIFDIYKSSDKSVEWLKERMAVAEREYYGVWMGEAQPNIRNVYKGLSRYFDTNYLDDLAECESGWDMNTRFAGQCLSYIPVDLNSMLYKYETDFARAYELYGDPDTAEVWKTKAKMRSVNMSIELWSSKKGFFFDLDYGEESHSNVWSLAGLYPLWAGLASEMQAEKIVNNLLKFINKGGLSTTATLDDNDSRGITKQWAYPNGWAPLHWLALEGLSKYGYHDQAELIARKWLKTNVDYFKTFGVFREVYNVVEPMNEPEEGVYPSQTGFGWTNGVFLDLAKKYLTPEETALI